MPLPNAPTITWIGHATFLIQYPNCTILVDPVFENLTPFLPRLYPVGLTREQLPSIDLVLITHNHRDHLEERTIRWLAQTHPEAQFLVPDGDERWCKAWGAKNVVSFVWWQNYAFRRARDNEGTPTTITFLPARHWSQRSLFDYNRSLWGSWMIEREGCILYCAGDTAYGTHFTEIAHNFSAIDYVLMPIGPCEPRAWMRESHISAEEAGQAVHELGARITIPMHWGTFGFGIDRPLAPLERVQSWWERNGAPQQALLPLAIGRSIQLW